MALYDIDKIVQKITLKHLRGQHNQKRHGWRYGSTRGIRNSMRGYADGEYVTNTRSEQSAYAMSYRKRQGATDEQAVQSIITRIERKIRNRPTEKMILIDRKTGKILFDKDGNEDSVIVTDGEHDNIKNMASKTDVVMTHNHPSSLKGTKGTIETLGSSFSVEDITFGANLNFSEVRAVSADGSVFVMKRPRGGWSDTDLLDAGYQFAANKVRGVFMQRIREGKMSVAEANRKHSRTVMEEFMKMWGNSYAPELVPTYSIEELPKAYQRR